MIQALIILNVDTYIPQPYHVTLLTIAIIVVGIIFNTLLATKLHIVEGCLLVLHVVGFFAIIIPLWVMSPRAESTLIIDWSNGAGWSSKGLAGLIGITIPIGGFAGYDCSVHMCKYLFDNCSVQIMLTAV